MSKLTQIQQSLKRVNETVFQELCDNFLVLRNRSYRAYSRAGSHDEKQKTTKGTPDSFLLLDNGNFLFVETTTTQKGLLKKLKEDISKCIDEKKTGVPKRKIQEIILCFNSKLSSKQLASLISYSDELKVRLTVYNLETLATEINLHHRNLAKEYLGLSLDTGQIVSLETFIKNYNGRGQQIATPLDNDFFHRTEELRQLTNALEEKNLIILAGPAGVGKTKLAIEGIKHFLRVNQDFNSYAIANKDADLLGDLDLYFDEESANILFIDDVNRFDKFSQVIGFFKYFPGSKLKIVMTVRDYALAQLSEKLMELSYEKLEIAGFTDEQIVTIIEGSPFNITSTRYQKEITRIANGNPRLAIMAGLLAIKEQNLHVLHDVSDLFDQYFGTFVRDESAFKQKDVLQSLGILSFFYTLPYNDSDELNKVLEVFSIQRSKFIDAIEKLENLELAEIQFEHVKIADQNLAIYYFYKTFIKEGLLSFDALLNNFFASHPHRFDETIISANNIFGYDNVLVKIRSNLTSYWDISKSNETRAINFLNHFWFYLKDETLEFIQQKIEALELPLNANYLATHFDESKNPAKNRYIQLLGNYLNYPTDVATSFELGFEYVRRQPDYLSEWLSKIKQTSLFDVEDHDYGFLKQKALVGLIANGVESNDSLFVSTFHSLASTLLNFQFQQSKPAGDHKISLYRYPIPLSETIKGIRKHIWDTVDLKFQDYPDESLSILLKHGGPAIDFSREIFEYDLTFVLPIIDKHLTESSFKHCYYVQELIRWCLKQKIDFPSLLSLRAKFTNQTYKWFLRLDRNILRGREEYEFDNWDKFRELKDRDIRQTFLFQSLSEFKTFQISFNEMISWEEIRSREINDSIDLVIESNVSRDPALGLQIFLFFIRNTDIKNYRLYKTLRSIAERPTLEEQFWISLNELDVSDAWRIELLSLIPSENLNRNHLSRLMLLLQNTKESFYFQPQSFERYERLEPIFFDKLVTILVSRNMLEKTRFLADDDFFTKYSNKVSDIELLATLYLQQDDLQSHFDFSGDALLEILKRKPAFVIDYLDTIFEEYGPKRPHDYKSLSVIWELENPDHLVNSAIDFMINRDSYYGLSGHFANAFFHQLSGERQIKATEHIFESIEQFSGDHKRMNVIFDIIHHSMKGLFEKALTLYLNKNQDVECFKKIQWSERQGVFHSDVIIADIRAAEWSRLLSAIEKMDLGSKLSKIKKYIKDIIASEGKNADWERKNKFLNPRR